MVEENYYADRDKENNLKIRKLLREELPKLCGEYFIGVQTRTTPLTRLGYAQDLCVFFDFLFKLGLASPIENPAADFICGATILNGCLKNACRKAGECQYAGIGIRSCGSARAVCSCLLRFICKRKKDGFG